MTAILLPGQAGAINDIDITQAGFREQAGAIALAARRFTGGTDQGVSTTTLYVDPEIGSDDWEAGIADGSATPPLTNQQVTAGYSKNAPFKTLQRALIEAARLSIVAGASNDLYDRVVINVSPGEHIIDNATAGSEVVSSWGSSFSPTAANLRAFNGDSLGVILPRGVSIIGEDLRKSVIRPTTVPASNLNPSTGRGAIFKATGGSFFFNFTFKDANGITTSHHLLSAFEFCSEAELTAYYTKVATAFGLNPSNAEIINPGETQITTVYPDAGAIPAVDSTRGSSPYVFNCSLRSDYGMCGMFLDGSKVTGFKSMVVAQFTNVSLQKDMNAWEIYNGTTWNTPASYQAYIDSDINDVRYRIGGEINQSTGCYQIDYRSFGFKCINDSIIQEVSCFVIGDAIHHWTASGGECTITNSNSNFGLTALLSSGFRGIGTAGGAYPQDTGFLGKLIRRALKVRTDGSNIRQITIGTVAGYNSVTGELTLDTAFDPLTTFGRFGYSLKENDYIWIENRSRDTGPGFVPGDKNASVAINVRAKLAATPFDENTPTIINVNPSNDLAINNITTVDPSVLIGNRVFIRRLVDTRTPDERKYSFILETSNPDESRRPVGNFIMRLGNRASTSAQVDPTNGPGELFIVSESTVHSDGGNVSDGRYQVVIRPGDSADAFTANQYYRVGTPVFNSNRIFRSKRNQAFTSFSNDQWEESLPMLTNQRGVESLRIAIGPELIFDKDLSNDPDSTDLGINQSTDADVLAQVQSATDYQGVSEFMEAVGYNPNEVEAILQLQNSTSTRDWDPSALTSPVPSGKFTSRGFWPLEFNRPSLIRAFGQAYEWAGQGNYSKAMPKYQVTVLSDQHKVDYFAVNYFGGRVYNTGFNEDGLIVQGDTINDLGTNTIVTTETAGLGALGGDPDFPVVPTSFDTLTVTDEFNALQQANFNNITINGTFEGSPTFAPDFLPVASTTREGIIELATAAEVAQFQDINKAITPATLDSVRAVASGIASLDGSGKLPTSQLPNIPTANLAVATTTQQGIIELATNAEAAALTDTARAVVPGNLGALRGAANGLASLDGSTKLPSAQLPNIPAANLPDATTSVKGAVELATNAEALALTDTTRALVPGNLAAVRGVANGFASLDGTTKLPTAQLPTIPIANLPDASTTQKGIVELATNAETAAYSSTDRAVTPSNIGALRAAANGLASLDGTGRVPSAQLPASIPGGFLPTASTSQSGIVELATNAEAAAFTDTARAVVPSNLGAIRGAANGLASLDGSSKVPTAQLPTIPTANLPTASTAQSGIIEVATNAEAAAYADTGRALVPSNLAALRGAANGLATLDGSSLLPTAQLPSIPLANIPTLTNAKLPVLELAKIPTLPANKLLTTPVAWVSGNANFDLSANFTFTKSGTSTTLALGAPTTTGYIGTSGFIFVTNATGVAQVGIDNAAWKPAVNTWVDPTTNTTGLTGNLLIGYYIAAANTVIYTATRIA